MQKTSEETQSTGTKGRDNLGGGTKGSPFHKQKEEEDKSMKDLNRKTPRSPKPASQTDVGRMDGQKRGSEEVEDVFSNYRLEPIGARQGSGSSEESLGNRGTNHLCNNQPHKPRERQKSRGHVKEDRRDSPAEAGLSGPEHKEIQERPNIVNPGGRVPPKSEGEITEAMESKTEDHEGAEGLDHEGSGNSPPSRRGPPRGSPISGKKSLE
ncbi:hypothetical protein C922_05466 [Plasmodium inui San Antonio 1]|uniref:Uncharacterized protein n=1 Tax=Plasmodium inui San Antonio 1 TaxID=1237626 RepID=W6ZXZ9_9APIC|nr:hypothetical protein C922_05466 [Plasmodium inui San Antonio 1]EUD64150.1 hypothetical protein C922_05466 [Plasmodium inui San Antonio 1]